MKDGSEHRERFSRRLGKEVEQAQRHYTLRQYSIKYFMKNSQKAECVASVPQSPDWSSEVSRIKDSWEESLCFPSPSIHNRVLSAHGREVSTHLQPNFNPIKHSTFFDSKKNSFKAELQLSLENMGGMGPSFSPTPSTVLKSTRKPHSFYSNIPGKLSRPQTACNSPPANNKKLKVGFNPTKGSLFRIGGICQIPRVLSAQSIRSSKKEVKNNEQNIFDKNKTGIKAEAIRSTLEEQSQTLTTAEIGLLETTRQQETFNKKLSGETKFNVHCQLHCVNNKIILNEVSVGPKTAAILRAIVLKNKNSNNGAISSVGKGYHTGGALVRIQVRLFFILLSQSTLLQMPMNMALFVCYLFQNFSFYHLEIRENSLGDEGAMELIPLIRKTRSLVHLDVSSNRISTQGATELFKAIEVNQSLCCFIIGNSTGPYRNNIKCAAFKACGEMIKNTRFLSILDLNGCFVGSEGLFHLAQGIFYNRSLCSLNLSLSSLEASAADNLVALLSAGSSKFRQLNISKNRLENSTLLKMSDYLVENSCSLRQLNCSCCNFNGDLCLNFFLSLERTSIQELIFDENGIDSRSVDLLEYSLSRLSGISKLSLNHCRLSDNGAKAISRSVMLRSTLHTLLLRKNHIGNEGATSISEALKAPSCQIKCLDLSRNSIGDSGGMKLVEAIENAGHLHFLGLSWNDIGESVGKAFESAIFSNQRPLKIDLQKNRVSGKQMKQLEIFLQKICKYKQQEDLKRKKEYIANVINSCSTIKDIMRESSVLEYKVKKEDKIFQEEICHFEENRDKIEQALQKRVDVLNNLKNYEHKLVCLIEGIKKNIIKENNPNEEIGKMKNKINLNDGYMRRLKDEKYKIKRKIKEKQDSFLSVTEEYNQNLAKCQAKFDMIMKDVKANEKLLSSLRFEYNKAKFSKLASQQLDLPQLF